jgi:hypothetical protein
MIVGSGNYLSNELCLEPSWWEVPALRNILYLITIY